MLCVILIDLELKFRYLMLHFILLERHDNSTIWYAKDILIGLSGKTITDFPILLYRKVKTAPERAPLEKACL